MKKRSFSSVAIVSMVTSTLLIWILSSIGENRSGVSLNTPLPYSLEFVTNHNKMTSGDENPDGYSGSAKAITILGSEVSFNFHLLTNPPDRWQTILKEGSFSNSDPIHDMGSISFTKIDTQTRVGIYWSDIPIFSVGHYQEFDETTNPVLFNFNNNRPNFFKVVALESPLNIDRMNISYANIEETPINNGGVKPIQNVVLMIGDGMGENHIKMTEAFNGNKTAITEKSVTSGFMTTASSSSLITDSAASASAMSTGQKVANGALAYKNGVNLITLSEFAKAYHKGVGIIATETVTGATPAAFSSHNRSRSHTDEIALTQMQSDIDFFIGAGKSYYDQNLALMNENNVNYYTNFSILEEDLNAAILTDDDGLGRFLAAFDSISTTSSTSLSPTLSDIAMASLNFLSSRYEEEGFFVLIEGSHIDKRSHDNDVFGMIEQLNGFDDAVSGVVDWAQARGDTLVMVVTDHETGGLRYQGEDKNEINDAMFSTTHHTAANGPFYLYFNDTFSFIENNDVIDNTDIAKVIRAVIRAETP